MLKEAMKYLRDTAAPNILTFDDKQFSDKEMKRICTKDYPDEIHMTTLTGLKDYLLPCPKTEGDNFLTFPAGQLPAGSFKKKGRRGWRKLKWIAFT